jgi:hypothetical protein
MRSKVLNKARRLFNSRKYNKVLQILEPQVFRYRQNFSFYYFLGISCLNTSDFGGGLSYLQRANDLNPDDIKTHAALAVIYLKKQDSSRALEEWFIVLDKEPNNKLAKKGLEVLKKYSKEVDLLEYINSGKFLNLLPGSSNFKPILKRIMLIISIIALTITAVFLTYSYILTDNIKRPEISSIELSKFGSLTETDSNSEYHFTDFEIRRIFESIRKYFDNYQDNLAMREINKLMLSNVDNSTREKISLLTSYITVPGFDTLKTNYTYQDFISEPQLYINCYVHWRGMSSNLKITENEISFDFLVGYDDKKVLEGIIPVILNFGARIDSAFPIEVLGKLEKTESGYFLEAVSIHQFNE